MKAKAIALAILLGLSFNIQADQRFETFGGYCHFSYDANDDDNEVYFSNCVSPIDPYDAGDGQGRLAEAEVGATHVYDIQNKTALSRGLLSKLKETGSIYLKGNQTPGYTTYTETNTACVMVTANYNAANDDQNETVYVSNDWTLEITSHKAPVTSYTSTADLNGDNVVNALDVGLFKEEYLKVEDRASIFEGDEVQVVFNMTCRNGAAQ